MADRHPPTEHYFSAEPAVATRPRTVTVHLADQSIELRTDRGVFSLAGLDPGTKVLLQGAPALPAPATLLDLGCGHGVVAIALARRAPGARVVAVDVNSRALELTRANATANGVLNLEVCAPDEVDPDLRFDAIYSNPPIRVGRPALLELLATWLARLAPGGHAYLVVQRHLGADSLAERLRSQGYEVLRMGSKRGYRLLEVRDAGPASHDG
jgi:16S rRNA (guanine1207-N2)-methyltransferase